MNSAKFYFCLAFTAVLVTFSTITSAQAPVITNQPDNLVKCVGNSGQITIEASGAATLHYQWYKDGAPFGMDSPVLDFLSLAETDEAEYYCNVSNGEGNVNSILCEILVVNGPPVINSITTENDLVCLGTDNLFSTNISGENYTVAWYHNSNLVDYGSTLLLESAELTDEGNYYIIASNSCSTETSATVDIDVVIPAEIVTQPVTPTVCVGEDVTFEPVAVGDFLYYIWMKNDVLMPTEQTSSITIENVVYPNNDYYNLIAYNICTQDTSNTVFITVNNMPQIVGQPIDNVVCPDEEVVLNAYAGGTTEVDYQWWSLEGGILGGEIGESFIPEMIAGDTSNYYCIMTNICGSVSSDTALIIGKEPPYFTQQPTGAEVCAGQNVSIVIKAAGTETIYYQWLFNGADVNGANIDGDDESTLIITGITQGQQGLYSCHISNECGFEISNEVLVTVNTPPLVTEQPQDMVICQNEELLIDISSSGTEPVDFEWIILDGQQLVGEDQDYLSEYANSEFSGEYFCILSNVCGEVSTDTISVEIRALPLIEVHPVGDELCVGDFYEMEIQASGAEPLDYLWYRNESAVSGETNPSIVFDALQVNQSGTYFCRVLNDCGYDDSFTTELIVGSPPAITWNPIDQNICELDTLNLIMDAQGDNYTLQWYFNNMPIPGLNDTVLFFPMVDISYSGEFYCLAYNACASVSTDTVTVVVNEAPELDLGDDIDLCDGETTTIGVSDIYVHYEWNNGLSYQPTLPVELGGTFILDVTGENSCHNRDTIIVEFHPYHQIMFGDETIIACGPYVLNAGEGGYSYAWNTDPVQTTSSITVTTSGEYWVTATGDSFGCQTTASAFLDVRTPISFSLGSDQVAPVDSFVNIGISPAYSEYLWNTGFTGPMLTVYGSFYGVGEHEFWMTATALNGCSHTDTINVTFWNNSGFELSEENESISVYPNPATDYLKFESESFVINNMEIYNVSGQLVANEIINSMEFSLNVSNFADGLYFIKIFSPENKVFTRKILIQ